MTSPQEFLPEVRRAKIDRPLIYEISEAELQQLERGEPESLFLTWAIFSLSSALSFFAALLTTTMKVRVFIVFVVISVVGFSVGSILLALYSWHRRTRSTLFKTIRGRMPPEGIRLIEQ